MNTLMKSVFWRICMLLFLVSCKGKNYSPVSGDSVVVATSSWTAAYAEAAGVEKVVILAPFEMEHPSEYELRPGDIPKLMNAEVIIYAGYEVMTERLKKGLNIPQDKLLLVNTDYSYEAIEKSVLEIAKRLGTEEVARKNLSEISIVFGEGQEAISRKELSGTPVIVHRFQSSLARELGLDPVAIFGPIAPEAPEIVTVSKIQTSLVIDNLHNPVGMPFKEVLPNVHYVQLLNFPGLKGTKTLTDVIRYNVAQITSVCNDLPEADY